MQKPRPPTITLDAIAIECIPYGEKDQVVRLLTRQRGTLSAYWKRRTKGSQKGQAVTPMARGRVEILERPAAGMPLLRSANLQLPAALMSITDPWQHGRLAYLSELSTQVAITEDSGPFVHDLLIAGLDALANGAYGPSLLRSFELKLLQHGGVLPPFAEDGGAQMEEAAAGLTDETRVVAARLLSMPLAEVDAEDIDRLVPIARMNRVLLAHLGVERMKTIAYLKSLGRDPRLKQPIERSEVVR